jgi:hypothetical protein
MSQVKLTGKGFLQRLIVAVTRGGEVIGQPALLPGYRITPLAKIFNRVGLPTVLPG